jgi:excisionase family DNA binding protein
MTLEENLGHVDDNPDLPLLISIRRTCKELDCSRPTVGKLLKEGRLRSVNLGRRKLVNYASVRAFAEGAA